MNHRSFLTYIVSLLAGACVLVVPTTRRSASASASAPRAPLLQGLLPSIPLSVVRTAPRPALPPAPDARRGEGGFAAAAPSRGVWDPARVPGTTVGPGAGTDVASVAEMAAALAPAPAGIDLSPLPSREIAVRLENVNTNERAVFHLASRGYVRAEEAKALESFFRCRRTGRHKPIHPATLALLADIATKWPNRTIEVISGYRAPPFGAPHSRHFLGYAIDLRVKGVRTAKVRDYVWRAHQGVGVGHYSSGNFLHVDSRDEDTAWSAREEAARPNYRPRWAKRARRGLVATGASTTALATR